MRGPSSPQLQETSQKVQSGCVATDGRIRVPVGSACRGEVGLLSGAASPKATVVDSCTMTRSFYSISRMSVSTDTVWGGQEGVYRARGVLANIFPGSDWMKSQQICFWGVG